VSDYLPFIVIGLIQGSVYGIAATGLVLTYKTSGIFNFGHGAVACAAAIIFYQLHVRNGVPWPLAALICVIGFGLVAGLLLERLGAALAGATVAYRIIATVGLILVVPAIFFISYGPSPVSVPLFLPRGVVFTLSGVHVYWYDLISAIVGVAAVGGLYVFFQKSKLGVAMRAVVDRPELVDLTGDSPNRVRRIAWIIGATFAAVSGLLLVNRQQQLDPTLLSLLVVQAFGAAVVGAFRSLPLAFAGGLLVGVAQAVTGHLVASHVSLQGLDANVPFIFLFIGLLVIPKRRLVELGTRTIRRPPRSAPLLKGNARLVPWVVVLALAVLVPAIVDTKLPTYTTAMAELPLFLSLGLLVRTSGQISLCQIGFAAIGATTYGHMLGHGLPWGLAVLIGGLVVVPVGAIVAIPAIRLSGLFLALATLGFGILLDEFVYNKKIMFGPTVSIKTARPHILDLQTDKGYYYLLLLIGLAFIGMVIAIERSRLGRLLRGMSDSPAALSMLGTNSNVSRVLVFCASAFMAGVSGALTAGLFSSISRSGFSYVESLVVLAVLMISGRRTVSSAVLGTFLLSIPAAYVHGPEVPFYLQLIFGGTAILAAVFSGGRFIAALGRLTAGHEGRREGPGPARSRMTSLALPVDRSDAATRLRVLEGSAR
jgi:branched-subunit amino acid ABC-type transport system permease component